MVLRTLVAITISLAFATPTFASTRITGTITGGGAVIMQPTASPVAGTYTSAQSVTLAAAGSSSIHFTSDGTAPSCTTGTTYGSAIDVGSSQTIKALSCYTGGGASSVASFDYVINIPAPEPTPAPTPSGGGGNGPPVGSFGAVAGSGGVSSEPSVPAPSSGGGGASVANNSGGETTTVAPPGTANGTPIISAGVGNSAVGTSEPLASATPAPEPSPSPEVAEKSTDPVAETVALKERTPGPAPVVGTDDLSNISGFDNGSQTAAAGLLGFNYFWWWLLLAIVAIGGGWWAWRRYSENRD